MVEFLRKLFIKNYKNLDDLQVRGAHGKLAGFFGVFTNLFLFIIKIVVGILAGSVAIIADSINNFADMGSSVVTLVGFKLASSPADSEHPYGHQRIEYIAGLIVAIIIIFVGGTLFVSSIQAIINYQVTTLDKKVIYLSIGILTLAILLKFWQAYVNYRLGKIINSVALKATSRDSLNDCISTAVILVANTIYLFIPNIPFSLDGVMGIIVSLFIVLSGVKLIKEAVNPLIGGTFDPEQIQNIINIIKEEPLVLGYHDPICHAYGPSIAFMTIHIEVDENEKMMVVHDAVDKIEKKALEKYGVILTIHADPIQTSNPYVNELRQRVKDNLAKIDEHLTMHDFRVVQSSSQTKLIFDCVIPFKFKLSDAAILRQLKDSFASEGDNFEFSVFFDKEYVKNANLEYDGR